MICLYRRSLWFNNLLHDTCHRQIVRTSTMLAARVACARRLSGCCSQQQGARMASTLNQPIKIPPNMILERTLNQVTLLGRVGSDPVKKGTTEHPMVEFSIATHSSYKNEEGEQTQKTDWHRICVFRPSLRDLVFTYLKKGQRVYLTGKIVYSSTKQDNVTQNRVSIFADNIIFFQGASQDDD